VRLLKGIRHGFVKRGHIGTVVEVRNAGSRYIDGISVMFEEIDLIYPEPHKGEWCCLFPLDTNQIIKI
jgi:hypothetical protein